MDNEDEEMVEEGFGVFIQERESTDEEWDESYDPELYDIYPSKKEAEVVKKELMEKRTNKKLEHIFIKKMTQEEMEYA